MLTVKGVKVEKLVNASESESKTTVSEREFISAATMQLSCDCVI